jgi:hypothetical protein
MTDNGLAALAAARLETLAALEHDQWVEWSRTVAAQGLTPERLARWERYWVPYAELDEETKEHDRKWARLVLAILGERGVFLPDGDDDDLMRALTKELAEQEAEIATLRAAMDGLVEAVETEWYNGNVDEGARDRILATARAAIATAKEAGYG